MKKLNRSIIFCCNSTSAVTVRQLEMQAAISAWMRQKNATMRHCAARLM